MSRRTFTWVAAALAGIAVIVVVAFFALRPSRKPINWTLLGTKDGGRTLVVGFGSYYAPCTDDLQARLGPWTSDRVDLVVDARVGGCTEQSSIYLDPIEVRLDQPLKGQAVSGAGRTIIRFRQHLIERSHLGVPNLTGLSLGDAQAVGAAFGLRVRSTHPEDRSVWTVPVARQRLVGRTLVVEQDFRRLQPEPPAQR